MEYTKQIWQDGVTPLDAQHMNYMEEGIAAANQLAESNTAGIERLSEEGEGLANDLMSCSGEIANLRNQALMKSDKQSIITDTLAALAGADPSNASAAAIQDLNNRTRTLERKVTNATDNLSTLQMEVDELEMSFVETIVKIVMRLVQLERNAGLQPPVSDDLDTNLGFEDLYDDLFGQT